MRFLADENVSYHVVEQLRNAGFDVMATSLANPGASDSDVLATARRDGRILITEDRDFGELVVRQRLEIQGIVLLELDRLSNVAEADRVSRGRFHEFGQVNGESIGDRTWKSPYPTLAAVTRTPCRALA